MLRLVPLVLLALSLFSPGIGRAARGGKGSPFTYETKTLPNGLKVVAIPYDSPGIVAYYTVVRAGSRNEVEPGHSGFAHFFEHMMFRGTEKYPTERYNEVLKRLGADSNAFTTDDFTCYHIVASKDELETIVAIESDRFQNLKYSEEAFRTEAGAVLGEYNKNYSIPYMDMFEKLRDNAFASHTYKHTTMGFLKDIEDMPNQYAYSLAFFDRFYRPENCIILAVGDVEGKTLFPLIEKYYGSWEPRHYAQEIPPEPRQEGEKTVSISWKNPTLPYLLLGYHVPAFSDRDAEAVALDIFGWLVFSEVSDLYRKLVIEEGLVELLRGGYADHRDPYLFTIVSRVKEDGDLERVRQEIEAAIERVARGEIDEAKLKDVKSHVRYSLSLTMDSPDAVANTVAQYLNLTGDVESLSKVYNLYEEVTPSVLQRVAGKYFRLQNRTLVTLTYEGGGQS
jgi:zinc protease